MTTKIKVFLSILGLWIGGLLTIAAVFCLWGYEYPYGSRGAIMLSAYFEMLTYASDHNGEFPSSEDGPYASLQKLYPEYVAYGYELAGLSGPLESITNALGRKTPLNASLTSWVYVQGLKTTNDPNIALFWEAKAGLYRSGRRSPSGSRAVMLLDGTITNVLPADWQNFQRYQSTLLYRDGITNRVASVPEESAEERQGLGATRK